MATCRSSVSRLTVLAKRQQRRIQQSHALAASAGFVGFGDASTHRSLATSEVEVRQRGAAPPRADPSGAVNPESNVATWKHHPPDTP